MKTNDEKFVVHEGLTDLEQMKLEMLRTVVRKSVHVLLVMLSVLLLWSLLRAFIEGWG